MIDMQTATALIIAVLEGVGAAALAAAIGFAKAYFASDPPEAFDPVKFGDTVALGAIMGGIAAYFGIGVLDAQNLLVSLGLFMAVTFFVDAGVKALVRFIRSRLPKPAVPPA